MPVSLPQRDDADAILTAFRESDDRYPAIRYANADLAVFTVVLPYVWNGQHRTFKHRGRIGQIETVLAAVNLALRRIPFKLQL